MLEMIRLQCGCIGTVVEDVPDADNAKLLIFQACDDEEFRDVTLFKRYIERRKLINATPVTPEYRDWVVEKLTLLVRLGWCAIDLDWEKERLSNFAGEYHKTVRPGD